jgi:hypothetical protein
MAKDLMYRAIFSTTDGRYLGLNFFAENRPLALDHAGTMARDSAVTRAYGPLVVRRVSRGTHDSADDAGEFYPVIWIGELRNFYRGGKA